MKNKKKKPLEREAVLTVVEEFFSSYLTDIFSTGLPAGAELSYFRKLGSLRVPLNCIVVLTSLKPPVLTAFITNDIM